MIDRNDPRYKGIIINEEYVEERFWEWGKWAYRLHDGREQFDRLVLHGLKPHHYLFDIGCGWLRGGIYFIDYLDPGHYYGFDKDVRALRKGELLLKGKDLVHKKPMIKHIYGSKNIKSLIRGGFGRKKTAGVFNYMMAYSVFTHLDPYMTARLFDHIIPFLNDTGKFFVTFFKRMDSDEVFIGGCHQYRSEEYSVVEYPFSFFQSLAHENGLNVEHLYYPPDLNNQYWMCFRRK